MLLTCIIFLVQITDGNPKKVDLLKYLCWVIKLMLTPCYKNTIKVKKKNCAVIP